MTNKPLSIFAFAAVLIFCGHAVRADDGYSFGFSDVQVKYDSQRSRIADDVIDISHRGYHVSIENRCFKDLDNVEIKYTVFATINSQPKRLEFETKVPLIRNGEKFILNTEPVELRRIETIGTADKNSPGKTEGVVTRRWTQNDILTGLWLRMFINGSQVSDYFDPPTLKDKVKP